MSRPLNQGDAALESKVEHNTGGIWRWTPLSQIKALFDSEDSDSYVNELTTQRETPLTGATVAVTDSDASTFLLITPAATISALTLTLPNSPNSTIDKQLLKVFSTQAITTLTLSANGASGVIGEPSGMSANDVFTLRYDEQNKIWYRDS